MHTKDIEQVDPYSEVLGSILGGDTCYSDIISWLSQSRQMLRRYHNLFLLSTIDYIAFSIYYRPKVSDVSSTKYNQLSYTYIAAICLQILYWLWGLIRRDTCGAIITLLTRYPNFILQDFMFSHRWLWARGQAEPIHRVISHKIILFI
jgi:hypothetical protein